MIPGKCAKAGDHKVHIFGPRRPLAWLPGLRIDLPERYLRDATFRASLEDRVMREKGDLREVGKLHESDERISLATARLPARVEDRDHFHAVINKHLGGADEAIPAPATMARLTLRI